MLTLPERPASAERVAELRLRKAQLEQDIARLEPEYERALRNRRGDGLPETGRQLMRLSAAADSLAREIRRLEA